MNCDWYVAEPDGSTIGPMTRDAVVHAAQRRTFSSEALAWHVDVGEWQPLARILLRFGRASQDAPARGQASKAQVRDERQKQRELPVSQRTDSKTEQAAADRKRRVAEPAKVARPPKLPDAAVVAKTAAEASGRKLALVGKRALARYFDVMSIGMFVAVLLTTMYTRANDGVEIGDGTMPGPLLLLWVALIAMVVFDAVLLASFGTTPGKALLGLRVCKADGSNPDFGDALQRSNGVFARGFALGVAIFTPLPPGFAAVRTLTNDIAPWDKSQGLQVESKDVEGGTWKAIGIGAVVLWLAMNEGWWQSLVQAVLR